MIQPRGFGPNGESVTSPSACSTFHDTSFQVPMNCALTERDERQFGEKYSRMKSRRTLALRSEVEDDASFQSLSVWGGNVRFGSKADICAAISHVRFTPNSGHVQHTRLCLLWTKSRLMHRGKNPVVKLGRAAAFQQLRACNLCTHLRIGRSCGVCLTPGFYVRAIAIFEVMLALTFPSLRSGARCALMAAFNLSCVPAGDVARDGASGVASRALAA
jgi:hypothetical protein